MIVFGKDVQFLRTVEADCEIEEICPDKNIERISELAQGNTKKKFRSMGAFIRILNEGYENNKSFTAQMEGKSYDADPISEEMLKHLTTVEFNELFVEAVAAFIGETPTIEVEEEKDQKKSEAEISF